YLSRGGLRDRFVVRGLEGSRVAGDGGEQACVEKTEDGCCGEVGAQAVTQEDETKDGRAEADGEFGCGVKDSCWCSAFALREPKADGFGVCWVGGGLSDTEQKACCEEEHDGRGDCCQTGGESPKQNRD